MPRFDADYPCVFVTITDIPSAENARLLLDMQSSGRTLPRACLRIISEFSEADLTPDKERNITSIKSALCRTLAHKGFTVNPGPSMHYKIYVADLDHGRSNAKEHIYVGMTSKDPEIRLNEHRNRVPGLSTSKSKLIRDRREDLEPTTTRPLHSSWNAEVIEEEWGRVLEARGFTVVGPKGFSKKA